MKRWTLVIVLNLLLLALVAPVLAAPLEQEGGGVHFGPYTLSSGDSTSGDLTVFGSADLKEEARFDGDLTVFGDADIEQYAVLDGTLVVLGAVRVAGTVDGDLFAAGQVILEESAYINGDISSVGEIIQKEGATIDGDIIRMDEDEFDWGFPIDIDMPGPFTGPEIHVQRTPFWARAMWKFFSSVVNILVMSLLALVIVSIWPQQTERIGHAIEEAPLPAFGLGLLIVLLTPLVFTLLAITLCLLPLGILGLIIVAVGVLLGWVALGLTLGKRLLKGLFGQQTPQMTVAAVVGTGTIALILALAQVLGPLHALLIFVLIPPAAGAVLLTRFGTMPYASHGHASASLPTAPAPSLAPMPPVPAADVDAAPAADSVQATQAAEEERPTVDQPDSTSDEHEQTTALDEVLAEE